MRVFAGKRIERSGERMQTRFTGRKQPIPFNKGSAVAWHEGCLMTKKKDKTVNPASSISSPAVAFPDWFCLKATRENFHIDPDLDHQFLFGKSEWRDDIDARLRRAVALKEPIRLVWWGQYGIGKTHRLRFMEFWVKHRDFAFHPVHVVCRDIDDTSTFDRLHSDLVNNLGRDRMHQLVARYCQKLDAPGSAVVPLEQLTTSSDIIGAIRRLAVTGDDEIQQAAWKFLIGGELSSNERSLARVSRECIDSSVEYAGVLRVLGAVIAAETGKQLLYLIDQVEALVKIRKKSAEGRWVETLRAVLDVRNVGIVMAIGAEDRFDGLPSIMIQPEIIRRFTINNYLEIGAFKREQTAEFLEGLLHEWIDESKRDALAKAEGWTAKTDYLPDTYPLSKRGWETLCRFCSDELDHKTAKPSEIIETMNRITYDAYSAGLRLIDDGFLKTLGITA